MLRMALCRFLIKVTQEVGVWMVMFVFMFHFSFWVALSQVLQMSGGQTVGVSLSGSPDVLQDLVYVFLELMLFSGFGGESGLSAQWSWKTCGALCLLRGYLAIPCPMNCFLSV